MGDDTLKAFSVAHKQPGFTITQNVQHLIFFQNRIDGYENTACQGGRKKTQ